MPVKRTRKLSRPSTAPAEEERSLLPSHSTSRLEELEYRPRMYMQTVEEDDAERGLNRPSSSSPKEGLVRDLSVAVDYDWAAFISCYASGQWDPHRTPNPPKSHSASVRTESPSPPPPSVYLHQQQQPQQQQLSQQQPPLHHPEPIPMAFSLPNRTRMPLVIPPHRLRNSFSTAPTSSTATLVEPTSTPAGNADLQTSAATMRWAAARMNFAPLSLPSPEHELTDPMRGVNATIPGSHLPEPPIPTTYELLTPGGSRRTKLAHFWKGTQDVNDKQQTRWTSIPEGPNFPPTSVPAFPQANGAVAEEEETDYFGDHPYESPESTVGSGASSTILTRSFVPEPAPSSVPAPPRRICLTRQTSSPLPSKSSNESVPRLSDTSANLRTNRSLKEEQMFNELGFLAPPHPPDELQRRRAMYKFNIWNTGSDLNFDRIAHLAKLVFNTKGVHIALLDAGEQFLKSEWGLKEGSAARIETFCGHAILQQGDEPMVVLDTFQDWRFSRNPCIIGPNIRFYAGAPLRTSDGFNIGSLAILDDSPRDDFTPRQRHTLKEFAAIVMREMELWRDKIQLRIRDRIQSSMEQFSRECLEIDSKGEQDLQMDDRHVGSSMERVYDRAAKLIQRTLDVSGVCVMDVSHCQVVETANSEGTVSVVMHHGDPALGMKTRQLAADEYAGINAFFAKYPDGRIFDGVTPVPFRPFLPTNVQYALTVPIFNVDKRPFALLYAYNDLSHPQRFLEGHELSYMRAIGVIILSAVLKRRMLLADKAKSLFISNISHELRTPLHGILAAAELLGDSPLNHNQVSFLETVQACGTSLVETVNHVLDFTKLSGNSKSGGVENVIVPTKVDLMHLIEEAVDGCFIGYRARTAESAIGSVYSPPKDETLRAVKHVETVIDVDLRKQGWSVKCEKGGIRRILMNIFSNALKFTQDGFVHVTLRQLPAAPDDGPDAVKVELSVCDTGKGISQNFLKNQLFHPFSQENPLQTGTGLGLAIVNSIVQSESVHGKLDVWSEEGVGTDIKVTFTAIAQVDETASSEMEYIKVPPEFKGHPITVSLVGFDSKHRGSTLLASTMRKYLVSWWGFEVLPKGERWGQIVILNEDHGPIVAATQRRDTSHPFVILLESRGKSEVLAAASEHDSIGGFCRIIYKPAGPSKLRTLMKLCVHTLQIAAPNENDHADQYRHESSDDEPGRIIRRKSEDHAPVRRRPRMMPRSITASPVCIPWETVKEDEPEEDGSGTLTNGVPLSPADDYTEDTISVGNGGTLLKSSVGSIESSQRQCRVLVVEDNSVLRNLLVKWLKTKGYDLRDAVDGHEGVNIFKSDGPFDIVLIDLSMPVLDGVGATKQIRQAEEAMASHKSKSRSNQNGERPHTRILALTGMSSLEDKRRAFDAGVDGYLVKPVAFKTLGEMFSKLGLA